MPTKRQLSKNMESQLEFPQTRRTDDPAYVAPKESIPHSTIKKYLKQISRYGN